MGKSIKRLKAKAKNDKSPLLMTRSEALKIVSQELTQNPSNIAAKKLISLFGLTAEELSEVGITYEILRTLDGLI
ncbi:MAG: hypothetical protein Q8880_11955 [Bacteroidota bacterium]|nr:hypothetical protein [Bacteroidota bacterium]